MVVRTYMIKKNKKIGIILSAISYPVAYVLATLMYIATYILDVYYPGVVPIASMNVSIYSLVITLNVIAVICAFDKSNDRK